jgi:uncharacterized protein (TIGR02391 family)
MPLLNSVLPDADALLALEPEELAGYVLEYLNSLPTEEQKSVINRYSFSLPHTVSHYPPNLQQRVSEALMEAWAWLEREGLIVHRPGHQFEWQMTSRRGKTLKRHSDVEAFRKANLLPRALLHPQISTAVWSDFLRGDYESAVFKAFKEVEIAVRAAGGFAETDLGVNLMREAFHATTGPLTDMASPVAEREARSALFAGAIGSYKNPPSHRRVPLGAEETVELVMFASQLLRIVDRVKPNRAS